MVIAETWVFDEGTYSYTIPMAFVPVYCRLVITDGPYAATQKRSRIAGVFAVLQDIFEVANFHRSGRFGIFAETAGANGIGVTTVIIRVDRTIAGRAPLMISRKGVTVAIAEVSLFTELRLHRTDTENKCQTQCHQNQYPSFPFHVVPSLLAVE